MSIVENSTIKFSAEEIKKAGEFCQSCPLNVACEGPDKKTDSAVIHDSVAFKPSDREILNQASCLNRD